MKKLDKKIINVLLLVFILCLIVFCAICGVKQLAYFFGLIMLLGYFVFLLGHIAILAPSVAILFLCSALVENKIQFILEKSLILSRIIMIILVPAMYFTILFIYTYLMFILIKFDFNLNNYWEFITTIFE